MEADPSLDVFSLAATVYAGLVVGPPPDAAFHSTKWFTPQARELQRLYAHHRRSPTEERAYVELRELPPHVLLDSTVAPALLDSERERLRARLREQLAASLDDEAVDALRARDPRRPRPRAGGRASA